MTDDIKRFLRECSKLTKIHYKNSQQKMIMIKYYKNLLFAPRKSVKLKMITTIKWLINSKILLLLLRRTGLFRVVYFIMKRFQQYQHYWLMANLFQIFVKRQIFLVDFFYQYTQIQNRSILPPFYIGKISE